MKILNPTTFYEKLILEGDISLYSANEYLDDNGYIHNTLDLEVFNKSGEWLENQMNYFNTEDDEEEITYGNLSYLSTVLDDTSYIVPQYTEIFKLELIAFEKDREKVIEVLDSYASNLNNYQYVDEDDNDIFITLGEHSTPVYGEKQDIGGAERFIASLSILVRVTTGVITTRHLEISVMNDSGTYEPLKYISFNMKRDSDVILDNKAGYEKTYDINKTDFTLVIGSLYLNDYMSKKCMEYLLQPESMENQIKIKYKDNVVNLEKEFDLYITSVNPSIQYGVPVSYTASFKKINI